MSRTDILGLVVFSLLVLGLVAVRLWGTGSASDVDGLSLVLFAAAGWLVFAGLLVDEEPPGKPLGG